MKRRVVAAGTALIAMVLFGMAWHVHVAAVQELPSDLTTCTNSATIPPAGTHSVVYAIPEQIDICRWQVYGGYHLQQQVAWVLSGLGAIAVIVTVLMLGPGFTPRGHGKLSSRPKA